MRRRFVDEVGVATGEASEAADGVLEIVASTCRRMRCHWGDVAKIVLSTAPLADLGALKPGVSVDDANDILWFFFGYSGVFHADG